MRWWLLSLALIGTLASVMGEDEAEGEDGVTFEDETIYKCVIESCSG